MTTELSGTDTHMREASMIEYMIRVLVWDDSITHYPAKLDEMYVPYAARLNLWRMSFAKDYLITWH